MVSGGGAYGASATTGSDSAGIDEKELEASRALDKRVAEFAAITKCGSKIISHAEMSEGSVEAAPSLQQTRWREMTAPDTFRT